MANEQQVCEGAGLHDEPGPLAEVAAEIAKRFPGVSVYWQLWSGIMRGACPAERRGKGRWFVRPSDAEALIRRSRGAIQGGGLP